MAGRRFSFSVLLVSAAIATARGQAPLDWEKANREVVRLKPSSFEGLSASIRADLERRQCSIPQTYLRGAPHNIVRGQFTRAGQMDVAVLCSRARVSSILVYPSGTVRGVKEVGQRPDADYLQVVDAGGLIGYSRSLRTAGSDYIRERHERYGGPTPPPLDHDGIEDGFLEKASIIWYWYRGRWLQLQGAD